MNRTQPSRARGGRRSAAPPADPDSGQNEIQHDSLIVAHLTVGEFLRRIPHEWHYTDHNRLGDVVGKIADSAHMVYLTKYVKSFGTSLRVFPMPLLLRVYRILSPQFGWPEIIDPEMPQLSDGALASREALIAHERVSTHLHAMLEAAQDPMVRSSIGVVLTSVDADCARLRSQLGIEPAASGPPAPAAVVS